MQQLAIKDDPELEVLLKVSKDYEHLFLGKRSGHLTEYIYCGDTDYYEKLVKEEKDYYLTSSEIKLLQKHKYEIANIIGKECNVIEIGPGPEYILKTKVIPLLNAFKKLSSYTAIDINIDYATQAAKFIRGEIKDLSCYSCKLDCVKELTRYYEEKNCLLFLGGTLGNFTDSEIKEVFSSFSKNLNKGEYLIFSLDCNEDLYSIEKAYKNSFVKHLVFNVVNHFKSCFMIKDFDPSKFKFKYEWNRIYNTVRLNLISTTAQTFYFNEKKIVIPKNKKLYLVKSKKFKKEWINNTLAQYGFTIVKNFEDDKKRILLYLAQKQ